MTQLFPYDFGEVLLLFKADKLTDGICAKENGALKLKCLSFMD